MKDWFLSRAPRERVVLAAGAVIAAALILWRFVWMPLSSGAAELRAEIDEKTRFQVDLLRAAAIAPREESTRARSTQSLLRSEERRVGKEGRRRRAACASKRLE